MCIKFIKFESEEMIAARVIRKIIHLSFFLKITFLKYQLFSNVSKAYVHKPYFKVLFRDQEVFDPTKKKQHPVD